MSVSVVIPTRDRPESLARALERVVEHADPAAVEMVVVDDGSGDRAAVEAAAARHPGARLVRGDGTGPAAARNLGVRAAQGEVVCFLDDDCEPAGPWPGALADAALGAGAAAGRTVAPAGAASLVRAAQAITNHLQESSLDESGRRLGFAPTSNLAVRRDVLLRLPFDESFPLAAGEDREWCARAGSEGIRIAYEPDALVIHRPQLRPAVFWRRQYEYGRGASRFRAVTGRGVAPAAFYAGLVRAGFRAGALAGAAVLGAQAATGAGAVAERLSRLR